MMPLQHSSEDSELERMLIGDSLPMQVLRDRIRAVARSDKPVLILGESGTGKELVAQAIGTLNGYAERPFQAFNVPAIPHDLFESQFFGHRKGTFTGANEDHQGAFESAEGGTLLLDEIGDLPLSLQPKLLRVLETKQIRRLGAAHPTKVNVRVLASTNHDLQKGVEKGKFRLDLYHRLSVLVIQVPPLRDRTEDILALTSRFVAEEGGGYSLTDDALLRLQSYHWPGNVRELRNAIATAIVFSKDRALNQKSFDFLGERSNPPASGANGPVPGAAPDASLSELREQFLRNQIVQLLKERPDLTRDAFATELGCSTKTLDRLVRKFGLQEEARIARRRWFKNP